MNAALLRTDDALRTLPRWLPVSVLSATVILGLVTFARHTPAWDLLDWPTYFYRPSPEGRFGIVSSSRGCAQACSFCSQQKLWERTWRARDPELFVDELEMLRDTFDVRTVMLSDETPTSPDEGAPSAVA